MSAAARLTVAIATTETRLPTLHAKRLPSLPGLHWQIFVQSPPPNGPPQPAPPNLARSDITLTPTTGKGAASNRNAALKTIHTDFLLFADDDLDFSAPGLQALLSRFETAREVDFLCARLSDETGAPRKRYSADGQSVRWWNCGKVGTPELALRPDRFRACGLAFDTRFGAGMPDYLGDEYIFLCDALRAGLRGRHVALTLASHPAQSSGTRADPAGMEIRRRVLIRALGRGKSHPARLAFALRHWRHFSDWRAVWRFLR